jgi:hypothetical protein
VKLFAFATMNPLETLVMMSVNRRHFSSLQARNHHSHINSLKAFNRCKDLNRHRASITSKGLTFEASPAF